MKKEKRTLVPWPVACGCRQLLTVAVKLIAKTLVTQAQDNSVIPGSHQYIGLHFILGPNFQGPNFEGPWKLLGEFGIQYCIKTSLWFLLFGSRPMQLPSVYTEDADLSVNIHQLPTKWQWHSKMKKKQNRNIEWLPSKVKLWLLTHACFSSKEQLLLWRWTLFISCLLRTSLAVTSTLLLLLLWSVLFKILCICY